MVFHLREKRTWSLAIFVIFMSILITSIQAEEEYDENGCKLVQTVTDFDIDLYASQPWYIHAQAVTRYSPVEQNYCVKAEYTVQDEPNFWGYTVDVNNKAQNQFGATFGGELCAYQKGDEGQDLSKLAVAPCWLPKIAAGPYWVVAYNETEGYALISGGQPYVLADPENPAAGCRTGTGTNNSGLWIFSRSQERDEELIGKVRTMAQEAGFDVSVLNDVNQTNCDVCMDSEDSFPSWWGHEIDCEWVRNWKWAGACHSFGDYCPATCGRCVDD